MRSVIMLTALLGLAGCVNPDDRPDPVGDALNQCEHLNPDHVPGPTAPYWRCVRDTAVAEGISPDANVLLSSRVVIAEKADAGTLTPDEVKLSIAQLQAQGQQMQDEHTLMIDQQIQTLNSF